MLADVDKGYQALADGVNGWIGIADVDKECQALTGAVNDSMTMAGGIKGYIASEGCVKGYMRMLLTSSTQIHLLLTFVSPNEYASTLCQPKCICL